MRSQWYTVLAAVVAFIFELLLSSPVRVCVSALYAHNYMRQLQRALIKQQ